MVQETRADRSMRDARVVIGRRGKVQTRSRDAVAQYRDAAPIHANGRRTRGNAIRLGYLVRKMLRRNGTVTLPRRAAAYRPPSGNNIRFY